MLNIRIPQWHGQKFVINTSVRGTTAGRQCDWLGCSCNVSAIEALQCDSTITSLMRVTLQYDWNTVKETLNPNITKTKSGCVSERFRVEWATSARVVPFNDSFDRQTFGLTHYNMQKYRRVPIMRMLLLFMVGLKKSEYAIFTVAFDFLAHAESFLSRFIKYMYVILFISKFYIKCD